MHPLLILSIAIGVVLFLIIKLRVNAFGALIVAATTVGALSPNIAMKDVMPEVAASFGRVCGNIGIVIAFAAVVGQCLMESGAADKIVRVFQRALGNASPAYSLVSSGFILSIPVFFDTVFYLLAPLARASRVRSGKNYALYLMAVAAGATATHALVPPTPGPLAMAEFLNVDIGVMILMGLAVSLPMSLTGLAFAFFWDKRLNIPLRDAPGVTVAQLEAMAAQDETNLPGFFESILPVILPVLLITSNTLVSSLGVEGPLKNLTSFVGNPNFALLAAMVVAVRTLARQKGATLVELAPSIERALGSAGLIILITSGGGAFGGMLVKSGIGDAMAQTSQAMGLPTLLLAFVLPGMLKLAQGSGTVSMITASSILAPLAAQGLPFHPVYLACMIGSGSKLGSWMNDSGFWVYAKMSGLTETETLQTWSILLAVLAFGGGAATLILATLFPMV
ncbi:MAG: GntP family permease [Acidobacteria bacterium]|nr:GntP family permease [Acidobacteriota bacterium]